MYMHTCMYIYIYTYVLIVYVCTTINKTGMIEATARLSNWDPGIQMLGEDGMTGRGRDVEFACDFRKRTVEITKNGLIFCENYRKIWVVAPE